MIESISIAKTATYGSEPEVLSELSRFNFLFGSNGSGKTTISRIIADEDVFPTCGVTWRTGTKLQAMVYNSDFVERNFNQSTELKGVFTLGEKQVDTLTKIAAAKAEIDDFTNKIESLTQNLQGTDGAGGKKGELATLEESFKNKCWVQKQKHDAKLQGAFEGYRNNQENFKGKVLQESDSNASPLLPLAELENKAESVFGPAPTNESSVATVGTTKLLKHETNPILKKHVIGKEDVDIAAMIKKLGNSDWVRAGRAFYDANTRACPFCQQSTTEVFAQSLNEYFDEAFMADSKAIDDLAINYATDAAQLQNELAVIIASPSRFLDIENLKAGKELLDSKITINNQHLEGKKRETSQVVELESLGNVFSAIEALIDSANNQVVNHNNMVANLSKERDILTAQVWKFVLEELKADLNAYKVEKGCLDKAMQAMSSQIETARLNKGKKEVEIRELEKQTTSVQPTIDEINRLLSSFGFQNFKLAKTASGTSYKLVRLDGSDAKATLSEGERNFVTFLYFYRLLKGSESDSGATTDRVVVFDDPVSSLDSDILFIVSSLIRGLFEEVRAGTGYIKQVFVLTHNVYFHKEVTFNTKRPNHGSLNEETFWVVRKMGSVSKLDGHQSNPIKTSYELLWNEVRNPDRSSLTIQNTMRRILENYFKILGRVDQDDICITFDGKEKLICKSLFSWVNAGSHDAFDDLYVSINDVTVEKYLEVFKGVFKNSGHEAHYEMMMQTTGV